MLDQTAAPAPAGIPVPPGAPFPTLTAQQAAAQAVIDKNDYVTMLQTCLATHKSEHLANAFLLAEVTKAGDVQVKKRQFLKAARRIVGGLPPFTEVALQLIASQAGK